MSQQNRQHELGRRTVLKTLTTAGVSSLALAGAAAANPGNGGPPNSATCDAVVPDDYGSIQAAVDAAAPGDTVCVKDGTYPEQVVVDKSLTLQSASGAAPTIEPASSPTAFTIAESGPTWEPMVFAYGGSESGGEVSGTGTVDVTLSGFTLDGKGTQPGARRKPAVLYRNAAGTVSDNTVENMGVGGKETFGILAYGDSDVTIEDNAVSDYERGGIGANGDGGAHPSPSVRILNNTLEGGGKTGEAWGPNGIQVGFGAAGKVRGNDVLDNRYSDEGPVAAGVLVFESDGVVVHDNHVANADIGLSVGSWGWLQQTADDNKFTKNRVENAEYGVLVESVVLSFTQSNPSASNNKAVNNTIDFEEDSLEGDQEGSIGIGVLVNDYLDNEFDPVAENNKLVRNTVSGYETTVEDQGSDTKIRPFGP